MEVVTFGLGDGDWRARYDRVFEQCSTAFIQQSTYWAEVIAEIGPDRPFFLLAHAGTEDLAGLPLYLYQAAPGSILTSVPQAGPLGGVLTREGLSPEQRREAYARLLSSALDLARTHRCLALTVITTFLEDDLRLYVETLEPTYVFENFTQYIDLTVPGRRSGGQRNNLARARKFGFTAGVCTDPAELPRWYELHAARHGELGATPLPYRVFENIFTHLVPRGKAVLIVARDKGRMAAGSLYVLHRDVMDVFAISMDSAYWEHAPNALTADFSMNWARERGVRIYNWQSSSGRKSGVYVHKSQWGSVEAPYYFVTRLLDDHGALAALGPEGIRAEYPWHYVVPFAVFQEGLAQKRFRKE